MKPSRVRSGTTKKTTKLRVCLCEAGVCYLAEMISTPPPMCAPPTPPPPPEVSCWGGVSCGVGPAPPWMDVVDGGMVLCRAGGSPARPPRPRVWAVGAALPIDLVL